MGDPKSTAFEALGREEEAGSRELGSISPSVIITEVESLSSNIQHLRFEIH